MQNVLYFCGKKNRTRATVFMVLCLFSFSCKKEQQIEKSVIEKQGGTATITVEEIYPGNKVLQKVNETFAFGYDEESSEMEGFGKLKLFNPSGDYIYLSAVDARAVLYAQDFWVPASYSNYIDYYYLYYRNAVKNKDGSESSDYECAIYKYYLSELVSRNSYYKKEKTTYTVHCDAVRSSTKMR